MVVERLRETEDEKGGEREGFSPLRFDGIDTSTRLGHVDLDEAVDVAPPACGSHVIDRPLPTGRERLDPITAVAHIMCSPRRIIPLDVLPGLDRREI
jgi:hypothetical protein